MRSLELVTENRVIVSIFVKKEKKSYFACSSISIIPNTFPSVSLHDAK